MAKFAYFAGHEQWQPEVLVRHDQESLIETLGNEVLPILRELGSGS